MFATSDGGRTVAELRAKNAREVKSPPRTELEQMELRLFHPDGKTYDLVKAERGDFFPPEGRLSSDGEVEVQMAVPLEGDNGGKVLAITAQGARLEVKTGKVETAGAVSFRFVQAGGEGSGTAVGAEYDPQTRELHLLRASKLYWRPKDTTKDPMTVESDDVRYREAESKVFLSPWAKMRKASFTMESKAAEIVLERGVIRQVLAQDATGRDQGPKRSVEYSAQSLNVEFDAEGITQKVVAEGEARLGTRSDAGQTVSKAKRIDLFFLENAKDSVLERALANGQAAVESVPPKRAGGQSETKILRSDSIEMKMRPGGQEIQNVQTHAAGTLDFVPNRAGQRRRHLDAGRMWMNYAANNQLEEFRAVDTATRTEPLSTAKRGTPPMLTSSKDLLARFDPKTGELLRLEQWTDFRYQEGERRARAEKAVQESQIEKIDLTGKARVWDSTASTDADLIVLQQRSGDFDASGNVRSSREEASAATQKKEVTQATADRMEVRELNQKIRYEGNAVLWKGDNRLRAKRIDIDRKKGMLEGRSAVVHQMVDTRKSMLTTVKSEAMDYSDKERAVEYQGGVTMTRPGLVVRSERMRAYLEDENPERQNEQPSGGVEKVFAYGKVDIVETGNTRTRHGTGETGEFYTVDGKLLLEGGRPELVDIVRGVEQRRTSGRQILWYANADRLIVDGEEKKPVLSTLQRKK